MLALGHSTAATTRFLLAHQAKSGGFAWYLNGRPDSNDTAAALEALRVARVRGKPVARAVHFLRSFQNRDGGFELTQGAAPMRSRPRGRSRASSPRASHRRAARSRTSRD